jgi:hypothetical protein
VKLADKRYRKKKTLLKPEFLKNTLSAAFFFAQAKKNQVEASKKKPKHATICLSNNPGAVCEERWLQC